MVLECLSYPRIIIYLMYVNTIILLDDECTKCGQPVLWLGGRLHARKCPKGAANNGKSCRGTTTLQELHPVVSCKSGSFVLTCQPPPIKPGICTCSHCPCRAPSSPLWWDPQSSSWWLWSPAAALHHPSKEKDKKNTNMYLPKYYYVRSFHGHEQVNN